MKQRLRTVLILVLSFFIGFQNFTPFIAVANELQPRGEPVEYSNPNAVDTPTENISNARSINNNVVGNPSGAVIGNSTITKTDIRGVVNYNFPNSAPEPYRNMFGTIFERWYSDGGVAYCIQFGNLNFTGGSYTQNENWSSLNDGQRYDITSALMYGYQGTPRYGQSDDVEYIATQLLIWNINHGIFNGGHEGYVLDEYSKVTSGIRDVYNTIKSAMNGNEIIPSFTSDNTFNSPTHTMEWDNNTGNYRITLTDTNNVLWNYGEIFNTLNAQGIAHRVDNGNQLVIETSNPNINLQIQSPKLSTPNIPNLIFGKPAYLSKGNDQPKVSFRTDRLTDPVRAYFNLNVRTLGNLEIIKTSEDNQVGGQQFRVLSGSGGYNQIHTTDSTGRIFIPNLGAEHYQVDEINVPDRYRAPSSQVLPVSPNATTTFQFHNTLKKGRVEIIKSDNLSNNRLNGAEFGVYNGSNVLIETITTTGTGTALSNELWYGNGYYIKESKAPTGYVLDPKTYPFDITSDNQVVQIGVGNQKQLGTITLSKRDVDSNVLLSNAVYDIRARENIVTTDGVTQHRKGDLVDTITTNANGTATTKQVFLGQYEIQEKTAPNGYVVDTKTYPVDLVYGGQNVSLVTQSLSVTNKKQMAQMTIKKEDFNTNRPLAGAVFALRAREDIITPDGILQHNKGAVVETLTVGKTGETTSQLLFLGEYELEEITAPYGYVIDTTVHPIDLLYGGQLVDIVTTARTYGNQKQLGGMRITNQGLKHTGWEEVESQYGTKYEPTYSMEPLEGGDYEVYAMEDIVTPDGTTQFVEGEMVYQFTMDKTGGANSPKLPLGKYRIVQIKAPIGFFIGANEFEIELKYAGQTLNFAFAQGDHENVKQSLQIRGDIVIEDNQNYPNTELYKDIVYGVFTRGKVNPRKNKSTQLPPNTLVDVITFNEGFWGTQTADLPFGEYYVMELKTHESLVEDTQRYPFSFAPKAQEILTVQEEFAGGEIIHETKKGKISITKTSDLPEDILAQGFPNKPLKGAEFTIYKKVNDVKMAGSFDESLKYHLEPVDVVVTDEKGFAESSVLPYGAYVLKETKAPDRYHIMEDELPFFIGEDGVRLEFEIGNAPKIGGIELRYMEQGYLEYIDSIYQVNPTRFNPPTGDTKPLELVGIILISALLGCLVIWERKRQL